MKLLKRMVELAGMARKDGMMALEGQPVPDKFFEKGMQMLVDGADEQKACQANEIRNSVDEGTARRSEPRRCSGVGKCCPRHGNDWYAYWFGTYVG